jgi:hypothetical protein
MARADASLTTILGPGSNGPRGFYATQIDRIAWRNEGMTYFIGATSMIFHPIYASTMRLMLTGACGDALTGSHLSPRLLLRPTREALIASVHKAYQWQSRALVETVLRPEFVRQHWDSRDEIARSWFDGIDGEHPMAIHSTWDMENRQRRGAFATFPIERYFATLRAPFLDYDLIDLMTSIPERYRFQQRLYKHMLVTQFPHARAVPWAYTEGPITSSPAYELAREAYTFARSRVKKLMASNGREHWQFRDTLAILKHDAPSLVAPIRAWIASSAFPGDVFDKGGIEALIDRVLAGEDGGRVSLFAHLCQISRFHQWGIMDGSIKTIPPECDPSNFDTRPVFDDQRQLSSAPAAF